MPAKKPAKKNTAKKASSRLVAPARREVHPLQKHYFLDEQETFFRKHPLAQTLLTVFLIAVVMFFVVVYMRRDVYVPGMMGY
jgi:hypothetical protein